MFNILEIQSHCVKFIPGETEFSKIISDKVIPYQLLFVRDSLRSFLTLVMLQNLHYMVDMMMN